MSCKNTTKWLKYLPNAQLNTHTYSLKYRPNMKIESHCSADIERNSSSKMKQTHINVFERWACDEIQLYTNVEAMT